jgi:3D (Asp-Asp-Asp) domain-containing protein
MKVVAVSLDLLELGLDRHSTIRIQGLDGEYVVLDRMPSHWTRRIDVYMGEDVEAARRWGKRRVTIRWRGAAQPGTAK